MRPPGCGEVFFFIRLQISRVHFIEDRIASRLFTIIAGAAKGGDMAVLFHEAEESGQNMLVIEVVAGRDVLDVLPLRMGKRAGHIADDALILGRSDDLIGAEAGGGEDVFDLPLREILRAVVGDDHLEGAALLAKYGRKCPAKLREI